VAQVNEQLAYIEQSYQQYNESLLQKVFDARGEEMPIMRLGFSLKMEQFI